MALLIKGVTKLSQLSIDANKDWNLKGITNVKELAAGMQKGDFFVHDGTKIIRLPASTANLVLTSNGPLQLPSWLPGGLYLNRYFPAEIELGYSVAIKTPTVKAINSPLATVLIKNTGDDVANYLKLLEPAVTLPSTVAVTAPNHTKSISPSVHSHYDLQTVLDGAFRSPAGVDADETAGAQSAAVNDMSLPPQTPGANDAYKFGHSKQFDVLRLNVGTAGDGVWTVTWEYWNGAWTALAGVTDGTNGFHNAGINEVTFTRPGDWAVLNLGGLGNQYYIRANISAYTSRVTQPLGTQAIVRIII